MAEARRLAEYRLRKHADYQRVYKTGRKKFGKSMGYFYAVRPSTPAKAVEEAPALPYAEILSDTPCTKPVPRVGLTVPKALGKAVTRNRIKRRLRAALRPSLPLLTSSVDVVLHPRRSAADCKFAELQQEIAVIFRSVQAGVEREPVRSDVAASAEKATRPGAREAR